MKNTASAFLWSACLLIAPAGVAHSQPTIDPAVEARAAEQASARGDFAAAEAAYARVLSVRPSDASALVGRAHALAFQKKYAAARADFEAVLAREPNHVGALVGLGHTLAWSGQYADAIAQFERALAVAPDNADAQRGAAYAELWRGNAPAAITRFERLLAQAPQDQGARDGLAQARTARAGRGPRFETNSWFGRTELPGGSSETGLRFAEIAIWPNESTRAFLRYDDGLSRDNAALAAADRDVALKSAGVYRRWNERLGTLLEIGSRSYPGGVDQEIYRVEQSFYMDRGYEAKLGGWYGPRDGGNSEWLAYVGGAIPFGESTRFEPTFFYSQNGLPGGEEWRLLLAANHRVGSDWEFSGGVAGGRAHVAGIDRDVREGFVRASYQLTRVIRLQGLARNESVQGGEDITVLALGVSLTW